MEVKIDAWFAPPSDDRREMRLADAEFSGALEVSETFRGEGPIADLESYFVTSSGVEARDTAEEVEFARKEEWNIM